mgnify:CR=1 FL=1
MSLNEKLLLAPNCRHRRLKGSGKFVYTPLRQRRPYDREVTANTAPLKSQ